MLTKPFKDLTGQVFGRLTVIERASNKLRPDGKRSTMWKCLCSCGTIKDIAAHSLRNGCTLSCSCLGKEIRGKKRILLSDTERLYNLKRYEAQRRGTGIPFSLTLEEFTKLVVASCYYCGDPPSQTYVRLPGASMLYSGIDRQDNNKGYITGNCVPCCTHCNQMKLAYTHDEFLAKVARIYKLHIC